MDALRQNLRFLVERGVQVVAMGGGTGEFEALTSAEQVLLARTALETVDGEALVVATVPGNIHQAVDLLAEYEQLGVEVVLAMPPLIRGKIPDDLGGVVEYYQLLYNHTSLPVMPHNTQQWPVKIFVLLAEIDNIVGVKDPCFNPHELFKAIQQLGDRFVWIGNKRHDPGVLHLRYQMGIDAFTSGQSNFWPEPELELHQAALRHQPIALQIEETAGIERQDWPLTRGVPLPQGAVSDLTSLHLTGPDDRPVPAQFRLLSRWPNDSIKWILVDFQADVPAGETVTYHLHYGDAPPEVAANPQLQIEENSEQISVCTGPLRFGISRERFRLFEFVELGQIDSAGRFEATHNLVPPGQGGEA